MGQCGCGDFSGDFRFKGPEGIIYVLQVYPPCEECDNPAGVIIYSMNEEDCKAWDVDNIQGIEIQGTGSFFSIAHPREIMKSVVESIEYFLEEGIEDELRSAVLKSIKDNKKRYKSD